MNSGKVGKSFSACLIEKLGSLEIVFLAKDAKGNSQRERDRES